MAQPTMNEPITGCPMSGWLFDRPLRLWVTAGRMYQGGFAVTRQLEGEPEFVLWEDEEGIAWVRGHGDDVLAALLLERSGTLR